MASVYAGVEGSGFCISMYCSTSFQGGMRSRDLATGIVRGLAGMQDIQNEKETMQSLNDRLASHLDRKLESKSSSTWRRRDPRLTVPVLLLMTRVKYETELAMHQSEESDIHGLHKVNDDTSVTRLQPETEIEALKEELFLRKKNHEEEVKGLQAQIASSGLTVEVDALKSQDLAKIMADIWPNMTSFLNREKLDKYWSQQIEESTTVVTMQSVEVGAAEINLDSMRNRKTSLENSLREVEARYTLQIEQLNGILLHLKSELAQTRAEGQHQAQEYEALLNIKVELEAEIATYCCLLEDGEYINLGVAWTAATPCKPYKRPSPSR
ncbi:LOW QUALITY PROTEIN: Keratin, type I cytoskeletal 18 [Plecturocebus cupreus]